MISFFLKGFFWGSFFFLSWPVTFIFGLVLGLFYRYWGIILGGFLMDILFFSNHGSVFLPQLPLTITAIFAMFLGTFFEKHLWTDREYF